MKELHPNISLSESSLPLAVSGTSYHSGVFGIRHDTGSASEDDCGSHAVRNLFTLQALSTRLVRETKCTAR